MKNSSPSRRHLHAVLPPPTDADFSQLVSPLSRIPSPSPSFDPSRPFNLVELLDSTPKLYKASHDTGSRTTIKAFPIAFWNTLDTLQKRVERSMGKNPLISACVEYGVDYLGSLPMIQEYVALRCRNSNSRQDLDPAIKNLLTEFLDGFTPNCSLRKKVGWFTSCVPHAISDKLGAFADAVGVKKAPLLVWCVGQALVIQPREVNGGVGVNDGYRREIQGYLDQVAHDLEIATRMARAIMGEFSV